MTDIVMKAYDVADEIKAQPNFKEMVRLNKLIDRLYPEEIKAFEKAKETYEEVMSTGGSYHPDFKKVTQALSQAKQTLYDKPEVKAYRDIEFDFEKEINGFIFELSEKISDNIPSPNAFGIVKKGGSCHVK